MVAVAAAVVNGIRDRGAMSMTVGGAVAEVAVMRVVTRARSRMAQTGDMSFQGVNRACERFYQGAGMLGASVDMSVATGVGQANELAHVERDKVKLGEISIEVTRAGSRAVGKSLDVRNLGADAVGIGIEVMVKARVEKVRTEGTL